MQRRKRTAFDPVSASTRSLPCMVLWAFVASDAQADDDRNELARQIERESETVIAFDEDGADGSGLFQPPSFRRYMVIDDCEVVAETEEKGPNGESVYGLTFDLARTAMPDPQSPDDQRWGVLEFDEHGEAGIIRFGFLAPYMPVPHGDMSRSFSPDPAPHYNFIMEYLKDSEQTYRLLSLLTEYQEKYCIFSQ